MALEKVEYVNDQTVITAEHMNAIQDAIIENERNIANIPTGKDGEDGKNAYQYAQDGGYTGTEAEFAEKLAEELPTALKNPNALTFTGAATGAYDGSEAKTVNIPTVPTAIKNPNALTFTGGATGTYDGSDAKTINIPTVPTALKNPAALTFTGAVDGTYDGSEAKTVNIPTIPTIPTALKNPKALTFTGAMTGTYDGSEAKTVNIPTIPTALKNPNALTFTGAATGTYDGSAAKTVNIPTIPTIPTALKNPNALTFTGAVTGTYDGSSAKTVNIPTVPTTLKNPNALTVNGQSYDGANAVDMTSTVNAMIDTKMKSVKTYGAAGDGSTDDTAAFQAALAANRVVFVPGGTYKLSGTLRIKENCELILSQDTVLQFIQTDKNCIEMPRLANLRGNHATIFVPYTFGASVIHASTDVDSAGGNNSNVPPFTTWDPMWKMSRYVTDVNICKKDSRGFHYSLDGDCYGTAVYIKCDKSDPVTYMWGVNMSGLRIAGGFTYGIRIRNIGETDACWNHDMRIEAVIDACETGVSIENCHMVHLAATVQPRPAYSLSEVNSNYAKYGIKLMDSHNVDLSQSLVWDWQHARTDSEEYTHVAMYGNCYGVTLNEPKYYESSTDVRDSIYTDTPSNLEKMTILQEPFTRWFKPVNNKPIFYDGNGDKRLLLQEEFNECFKTDYMPLFTDALAQAIDTDGSIYNGIGYTVNSGTLSGNGFEIPEGSIGDYGHTGLISCKAGDTLYIKNINLAIADGWCNAIMFDANFNKIGHNNLPTILDGTTTYYFRGTITEDGGTLTVQSVHTNVAYVRISYLDHMLGSEPVISVNKPIVYEQSGFLADGIKVKAENIVGDTGDGSDEGFATETYVDNAVANMTDTINDMIDAKLGVIENGSY